MNDPHKSHGPAAHDTECDGIQRPELECPRMSQNVPQCPTMSHPNGPNGTSAPSDNDLSDKDLQDFNVPQCPRMSHNVPLSEKEDEPIPWLDRLKPAKRAAIKHLVEGANICEVARRIGVNRKTVSRWLSADPTFEFALRDRLKEVWGETAIGMATHARKAVNKLAALLDSNHIPYRMKAAQNILALTPLARAGSPVGPYLPFRP